MTNVHIIDFRPYHAAKELVAPDINSMRSRQCMSIFFDNTPANAARREAHYVLARHRMVEISEDKDFVYVRITNLSL